MGKAIEVCRPCAEAMRRAGKVLREVEHRRDEKGTCFWCGRRRFVSWYEIVRRSKRNE